MYNRFSHQQQFCLRWIENFISPVNNKIVFQLVSNIDVRDRKKSLKKDTKVLCFLLFTVCHQPNTRRVKNKFVLVVATNFNVFNGPDQFFGLASSNFRSYDPHNVRDVVKILGE